MACGGCTFNLDSGAGRVGGGSGLEGVVASPICISGNFISPRLNEGRFNFSGGVVEQREECALRLVGLAMILERPNHIVPDSR